MAICIVDDSEMIRNVVKQALESEGFTSFIEAGDGAAALEKIKVHYSDIRLYVLDVNMPEMGGIELVSEIREFDLNTPIIMLTTETDKGKMLKAKNLGANGWIIKPFNASKFLTIVKMFIK